MGRPPRALSPLEWEIMQVIWDLGGRVSVRDVLERAYPDGRKAYTTVQTVMNNLLGKGYLKRQRAGLANLYTPARTRSSTVDKEVKRFVKRVFDGSVPALVESLARADSLEEEDVAALRELIRSLEERERSS